MTRIELEAIACQSCGAAQNPNRFNKACPDCGFGRFRVQVARRVRGFDPGSTSVQLDWILGFGVFGPLIQAAIDGPGSVVPFHSWTSKDELEFVAGEDVARFLGLPEAGRRRLYRHWKRTRAEANLSGDQRICIRCEMTFVTRSNPWNLEGYCSKKCLATDALASRPRR